METRIKRGVRNHPKIWEKKIIAGRVKSKGKGLEAGACLVYVYTGYTRARARGNEVGR